MTSVLKIDLQIICSDMTHHIQDGEVLGYAPSIVLNLLNR